MKPIQPTNKICPHCQHQNQPNDTICRRCYKELPFVEPVVTAAVAPAPRFGRRRSKDECVVDETSAKLDRFAVWFLARLASAVVLSILILGGVYLSLLHSAEPLTVDQNAVVERAVQLLEKSGFERETFLYRHTVGFRSTDNWLNTTTGHEEAYAATNFPFQIVTLYEDFFTKPFDDVETAAILLHEARHLQGEYEPEAYEFVWRNRHRLGWTEDKYKGSQVWQNVQKHTQQYAPRLFQCPWTPGGDCTK